MNPRELYKRYASSVAYVEVQTPNGDIKIGSAFHVGEGIFITARHVVKDNRIVSVGINVAGNLTPQEGILKSGPFLHPDDNVDVAAIGLDGLSPLPVPLGSHLDDWLNDDAFVLSRVLVLGYPPIPLSNDATLFAASGEINAVIDKYTGRHPHFIVSVIPRGGFSGGLCISEWDFALGLVTESLIGRPEANELDVMAVMSVEPIYTCLDHHDLLPESQKEGWDGLWAQ